MARIPFAKWRPDVAALNSNFTDHLKGALYGDGFLIPFPTLHPLSEALDGAPLGAITVRAAGTVTIFVGTASTLFRFDSGTNDWTPVSKIGADTIINGDFATDSDWTKGTGVTIAGGEAVFTAVDDGEELSQAQALTNGTRYKVTYTVSGYTDGGVRLRFTGGTPVDGEVRQANGTYVEYVKASGNSAIAFVTEGTSTSLSIDNVSLQPLDTYSATVDERWRFRQFGNYVVAVNINNDPQVFEVGADNEFSDLPGNPPRANNLAVWGDRLALFNGPTVSWCDTDDIGTWSGGTASSQTFPDGGDIQGATDATNPVVVQEKAIRMGTFVPGSLATFAFQKIHDKRGAISPYAVASRGEFLFFADAGAFLQVTPDGKVIPIGAEKVDRTIFGLTAGGTRDSIYCEVDPFYTRVYFAVKVDSSSDAFDRLIIYDWQIGEWVPIDASFGVMFPLAAGTAGKTLDDILEPLESLPYSLDSAFWRGGSPMMAAFDATYRMGFFSGDAAEAEIETQEMGDTSGVVGQIRSVYPVIETDQVTISTGARMRRSDSIVWSKERSPSTNTGRVHGRSRARFHKFRIRVAAGAVWKFAQGLDVESIESGTR